MSNRRNFDHLKSFRFAIEIEGVTQGAFSQCDGLQARIDVIEACDGNDRDVSVRKLPGRVRYDNIVLRRGYTASEELWTWFKRAADGNVERKSGSVIVLDDDRTEVLRYNFFEAWPCRWKNLQLDANQSGTLVEELEIAVEKIERG